MSGGRAAAIDCGSNTTLLAIGSLGEGGRLAMAHEDIDFARLGEGVDRTGMLSDAAMERGIAALRRYRSKAEELGVPLERIRATGTSAMRDAKNGRDFLTRVTRETGLEIEIIAGEREARLAFAASTDDLAPGTNAVVVDIGGGSTELIFGAAGQPPRDAVSFDVGAVRLTERHARHDPPTADELAAITADARTAIANAPAADAPFEVYGVSGTCTTLAAIHQKLAVHDSAKIHGSVLTRAEIDALMRAFRATDSAGRAKMPGLHPKRADVIIAGTAILLEVLSRYGKDRLHVSDRGIRHAVLREALLADR